MRNIILAALVAGAPLSAQSWELGLFAGQQSYKSNDAFGVSVQPKNKTVLGARAGYSVVDLGPALFQLTACFQFLAGPTGDGGNPVAAPQRFLAQCTADAAGGAENGDIHIELLV